MDQRISYRPRGQGRILETGTVLGQRGKRPTLWQRTTDQRKESAPKRDGSKRRFYSGSAVGRSVAGKFLTEAPPNLEGCGARGGSFLARLFCAALAVPKHSLSGLASYLWSWLILIAPRPRKLLNSFSPRKLGPLRNFIHLSTTRRSQLHPERLRSHSSLKPYPPFSPTTIHQNDWRRQVRRQGQRFQERAIVSLILFAS